MDRGSAAPMIRFGECLHCNIDNEQCISVLVDVATCSSQIQIAHGMSI
jgi:hypothetical protein